VTDAGPKQRGRHRATAAAYGVRLQHTLEFTAGFFKIKCVNSVERHVKNKTGTLL